MVQELALPEFKPNNLQTSNFGIEVLSSTKSSILGKSVYCEESHIHCYEWWPNLSITHHVKELVDCPLSYPKCSGNSPVFCQNQPQSIPGLELSDTDVTWNKMVYIVEINWLLTCALEGRSLKHCQILHNSSRAQKRIGLDIHWDGCFLLFRKQW